MNGTRQLLRYDDNVNLSGEITKTMKMNRKILLRASKFILNAEKTKHVFILHH
jgi:hypothetical protein